MQPTSKTIHLVPFGIEPSELDFSLSVKIERTKSILSLEYSCSGHLDSIILPRLGSSPCRLDKLWEHTCFEAFITWGTNSFYWELNLSPTGNWNFYRFDSYRENLTQELRLNSIQAQLTSSNPQEYRIRVELDLASILPKDSHAELCLGLTTVIEKRDHTKSYWAIAHKGPKPDFHLRDSFMVNL